VIRDKPNNNSGLSWCHIDRISDARHETRDTRHEIGVLKPQLWKAPTAQLWRRGALWVGDVVSIAACRRMPILSARFGGCALRELCLAQRLVLFEHAYARQCCNYIKRRRASSRGEPNRVSYKIVQPETKPQAILQPRHTGIRGAAQNPAFPQEICRPSSGIASSLALLAMTILFFRLDDGFLRYDDNPLRRHRETFFVLFQIVADHRVRRDFDILVYDRAPDL